MDVDPVRSRRWQRVRSLLGLLMVGLLLAAIVGQWDEVREALTTLDWSTVLVAQVLVVLGLGFSSLSWRAVLRSVGHSLPLGAGARIFFLSQLGKYAPGSVWPIVAQAELGREYGIPRTRSGVAALVALTVGIVAASALGMPLLAVGASGVFAGYWWVGGVGLVAMIFLYPPLLAWAITRLLSVVRRQGLAEPPRASDLLIAGVWASAMWITFGLQCYLIASDLAGPGWKLLAAATGAFSVSWVVGFLVVVAPAGAGAREVALVVLLSPLMGRTDALTLALVSRVLMSVGDLITAGTAWLLTRKRPGTLATDRQ